MTKRIGVALLAATVMFGEELDPAVLGGRRFDLLVLDEACQTTEPACWVPLPRCDRVVLAGDPCQLPPTVVSQEAARQGFGVSLLERLIALYGDRVTRLLDVQYRMHEAIMAFPSAGRRTAKGYMHQSAGPDSKMSIACV